MTHICKNDFCDAPGPDRAYDCAYFRGCDPDMFCSCDCHLGPPPDKRSLDDRWLGSPGHSFETELRDLLCKWRDKPADDKLTIAEAVGILHCIAYELFEENRASDEAAADDMEGFHDEDD